LGKASEYGQSNTIGYPNSLKVGIFGSPSNVFFSGGQYPGGPESEDLLPLRHYGITKPQRAVRASLKIYRISTTLMPACF
jgi:hypothetical protein